MPGSNCSGAISLSPPRGEGQGEGVRFWCPQSLRFIESLRFTLHPMNSEDLLISDSPPLPLLANSVNGNGAPETPPPAKANILVVDDRADKLLAMDAILAGLGQNVVQAHSGKEALRHLLHQDFAVILMDVSMPTMDGFETAALIRKRPRTETTPIIFITSINTSDNHVGRGYELGSVDYMLTPIVPE